MWLIGRQQPNKLLLLPFHHRVFPLVVAVEASAAPVLVPVPVPVPVALEREVSRVCVERDHQHQQFVRRISGSHHRAPIDGSDSDSESELSGG